MTREDAVSRGVFEQVMWERDIAIEQLHELGYELGQKIEPCDNAVSREAVNNLQKYRYNCGDTSITCVSLASINELPSVTRQTGEWIRWREEVQRGTHYTENVPHCKCSVCGKEQDPHLAKFIKFCPNCGADMRGAE